MKEIKFHPHGGGSQQQNVTFDTIKDHIIQQVQKTYKNGVDIAESLDKETKKDLKTLKPARAVSTATDATMKKIEQEGFDIEYKVQVTEFLKRELQLDENLTKTYALIYRNYCNRTIQLRMEEHKDFKIKVQNDPIEFLKAIRVLIRVLMHDPARPSTPTQV